MMSIHQSAYPQFNSLPTFTFVQNFQLPTKQTFASLLRVSHKKYSHVTYYERETDSLVIVYNNGAGEFHRKKNIYSIDQLTTITTGNLNSDGVDDIVLVQREQNKIIVLLSITDSTFQDQTFTVNYYPESAVIGDITGDNIPDIITLGRLSSGISVLRGKGKNSFREAKTLFGSLPVSSLSIIYLNADKLPDVVIHNWLLNEDVFFFGIGNLQFSEQTALAYGVDSTIGIFNDFNNDNITDVVLASAQNRMLQIFQGNGLANFVRKQNLSINQNLFSIQDLKLSESGSRNLLLSNASNGVFSLMVNQGDGTFSEQLDFGVPYPYWHILSDDLDGDGYTDLIWFDDSSDYYTIFWNALSDGRNRQLDKIAVGKNPNSISVSDLNRDGFDDVLVTNETSNSVSILYGTRKGVESQISIETSEAPSSVIVYSSSETAITLVTAHKNSSKLGFTILSKPVDTTMYLFGEIEGYTLSLSNRPSYVLPDVSLDKKQISLYVFSRGEENSILFYRQLIESQFVAKSITPLIPSKILFATIDDFNNDGYSDLVYLYTDKTISKDLIGITLNDENDEFKGKTYSYEIPDNNSSQGFIYTNDLDSDQKKDIIIYMQPSEKIYLILSNESGLYSHKLLAEHVFVRQSDHIQIYDFDTDGINDILYFDTATSRMMLLKGKLKNSFFPPQMLMDLPHLSVFHCGDFNGDGKSDIAYIQSQTHTINIMYGNKN